jgi:hypothetical protein
MRYLSFVIFVLLILTACTESNKVCEDCVDIVSDAMLNGKILWIHSNGVNI